MTEVEMTVLPTNTEVVVRPAETMLGALIRSGYLIRVGCKRGGCGICKVHVLAGEYTYERVVSDDVITEDDRAAGWC